MVVISRLVEKFVFFGIGSSGFGVGVVIAVFRHYAVRNFEVFRPFVVSVMTVISRCNVRIGSQSHVSVSVKEVVSAVPFNLLNFWTGGYFTVHWQGASYYSSRSCGVFMHRWRGQDDLRLGGVCGDECVENDDIKEADAGGLEDFAHAESFLDSADTLLLR